MPRELIWGKRPTPVGMKKEHFQTTHLQFLSLDTVQFKYDYFKIYNGIIYNIRILLSMSYIGNSWLMISFMKVNEYRFFKEKIHKNTHFSIQEPHKTKSGLRGHLNSTNLKDIFRG